MSELHMDAVEIIKDAYLGNFSKETAFKALLAAGIPHNDATHIVEDAYAYEHDYWDEEVHLPDDLAG
jgi:hypothetical protein